MPVSIRNNPFDDGINKKTIAPLKQSNNEDRLRTPQARVLAALMPNDTTEPVSEWPLITRAQLGINAGYTALSGTITRVLNGVREGSSSGDPHPGLLARGMIEEVVLDIDGVKEVNYRTTAAGIRAYQAHVAIHGKQLPNVRDKKACVNDRYKKDGV